MSRPGLIFFAGVRGRAVLMFGDDTPRIIICQQCMRTRIRARPETPRWPHAGGDDGSASGKRRREVKRSVARGAPVGAALGRRSVTGGAGLRSTGHRTGGARGVSMASVARVARGVRILSMTGGDSMQAMTRSAATAGLSGTYSRPYGDTTAYLDFRRDAPHDSPHRTPDSTTALKWLISTSCLPPLEAHLDPQGSPHVFCQVYDLIY